mmetsp:Transcript_106418/g.237579  ORF Transcript_106418/g.237579 Transcript_106418/m.237579 type:complete len:216 (+) Transcript_106418:214-861(+)
MACPQWKNAGVCTIRTRAMARGINLSRLLASGRHPARPRATAWQRIFLSNTKTAGPQRNIALLLSRRRRARAIAIGRHRTCLCLRATAWPRTTKPWSRTGLLWKSVRLFTIRRRAPQALCLSRLHASGRHPACLFLKASACQKTLHSSTRTARPQRKCAMPFTMRRRAPAVYFLSRLLASGRGREATPRHSPNPQGYQPTHTTSMRTVRFNLMLP